MSTSYLLAILSVASGVYSNAIPEPQITPAAVLPRQDPNQRFIGYYSSYGESTWDTARCAVYSTWTTSGSYGRCCSSGISCDFATSCSGNYALIGATSASCSYTCNTDYVYASSGDSSREKWVGCAYGYTSTSFYGVLPATALTNTLAGTTQSAIVRPTVTVISPIVPTSTPVVSQPKKKSMIWIVGVVVGVVAIFVIAGIIAWVLISKKKKKARAAALASQQEQNPQNFYGPPPGGFQPQMQQQQQYTQPGGMGMAPMPGQYGNPLPEGGYYQDPKAAQGYVQPVPPPVWTPSQQHQSTPPTPVSPQTRHASLAASDVLGVDQQRDLQNKSPGGTVSEMGSSTHNLGSPNSLGSNPNLTPQGTGTLSGISEVSAPTYPHPAVQKMQMQGNNHQGPVSELH